MGVISESWESDGEQRGIAVLAACDVDKTLHDFGVLRGYVVILVDVVGEVIEFRFTFLHHELPVALTHAYLICLGKLPVEMIVDRLLLTAQLGEE